MITDPVNYSSLTANDPDVLQVSSDDKVSVICLDKSASTRLDTDLTKINTFNSANVS